MPAPRGTVGDSGSATGAGRCRDPLPAELLALVGPEPADDAATPAADPDVFDADLDRAVRAFQQQRGLTVDGIVGGNLPRARGGPVAARRPAADLRRRATCWPGDDVLALQRRLLDLGFKVGKVDGRFGHQTEQAVRDFQRNVGVPADGTCGPATLKALSRLAPIVRGGSPNAMRAEERIRRDGPQLTGKIVVIDPSVGPVRRPRAAAARRRDHRRPRPAHRGPAGGHRACRPS